MKNFWLMLSAFVLGAILAACSTTDLPATEPRDIETTAFGPVSCHTPISGYTQCQGLSRGDREPWVGLLQEWLNRQGFNAGLVDDDFGPNTEAAVRRAQAFYGLKVDGFAGTCTWTALFHNSGHKTKRLYSGC